jgi:murein DD-endopeptidase MepM/ murein hydrolase activator NlpD
VTVDREMVRPSIPGPLVVGAAAVGGLWLLRHRQAEQPPQGDSTHIGAALAGPPPSSLPGRWVFPVPRWQDRSPVVSDGWGSPRVGDARGTMHRGADIMFRRRSLTDLDDVFPPRSPHTRWHFMPSNTPVLAASDGEVWSSGWTARGYSVVLSHGAPWATYYTHLSSLRIAETQRGASKQRVRAGDPLGVIGADPKDANAIDHLHFEMWFGGGAVAAVDPVPFLRRFAVRDAPELH